MAIQWRNIKNRFQYQQGWFGLFRTRLPSWLGGIERSQYAYAQKVYQLAPQNENDRRDITFNDYIDLLELESPEDYSDLFFVTHKRFLKETFTQAAFTLNKDTLTQIAQHFNAFQTHIKQVIDGFIYDATLKERLFFISELLGHNHLSTTTYFCQLLVTKETVKEAFLNGTPELTDSELNTLFPSLYAIKDVIDDNDIDTLVDKNDDFSRRIMRRYLRTTHQSSNSAYVLLSTLHHKRYQVLNIPFIDKFLNFFKRPPLKKENLLHHFIDRLIDDPQKAPTKAELALFNLYRAHKHKGEPYYALIARHFNLPTEEIDAGTIDIKKAYRFNALSAIVHIKASTQETAPLKIKVYETKLQKMLEDIIDAHTPIRTRDNQRFWSKFRGLTVSQPSSDTINSFIKLITKDDKYAIAKFKESDPLIRDLRALHKETKAYETDKDIVAYHERKREAQFKERRFLEARTSKLHEITQGIRTGNCKFVDESDVDKASLGRDGKVDKVYKAHVLGEIKKWGGVVMAFSYSDEEEETLNL